MCSAQTDLPMSVEAFTPNDESRGVMGADTWFAPDAHARPWVAANSNTSTNLFSKQRREGSGFWLRCH